VTDRYRIDLAVNGEPHSIEVEARRLLVEALRRDLGLTGTHVGCETGYCGACTVILDGAPVKSCMVLAVQADGGSVETVEGLAPDDERLHPVQEGFWRRHGLQCGFCTPGMLMTTVALLRDDPSPSREAIRHALDGNLCRCTGYQNILAAVEWAAATMRGDEPPPPEWEGA
jgi:carbon-monoxide dehydrogenase small subunit